MIVSLAATRNVLKGSMDEKSFQEDKLSTREAFLSTIHNTAPVIILLYDLDSGKVVYANRSKETLCGLTADEICSMSAAEHFRRLHPHDVRRVLRFIRRCRTAKEGEALSIEYRYRDKAGLHCWFRTRATPFARNKENLVSQMLCVTIDINEYKRIEEDIKHYTQNLLRSNRDLEQFASIASHDLQEPLHITTAYIELIKSNYGDKLDENGRELLDLAIQNAHKMQEFVQDLLSYSRVGRQIMFREVEMDQVLNQVLKNLSILIQKKGATIKCNCILPRIMADRTQMTQLFQNLIHNAIKFSSPERLPEIHISAEEDKHYWTLVIKDNGLGIPPECHDRIFNMFERLHSGEEYPGTGIGLAVCKKIVECHQGKIWIQSEYGKGTTFYISFPKEKK